MIRLNSPLALPPTKEDIAAAKKLKQLWEKKRSELHLTQMKVADLLDISQPAVSKYLNGVTPMNVKTVLSWAKILKVSPNEIRPDWSVFFLAASNKTTVPLVAELTNNGCSHLFDKEVAVLSPVAGEIRAVRINSTTIPGYSKGQLVIFTPDRPINKDRDVVAYDNEDYCLAVCKNKQWCNIQTDKPLSENASLFAIVGAYFED
jgi:transcriptional regulator with XRE-family HTH domain